MIYGKVLYSAWPASVTKLTHVDGVAEYRMTRDIARETDSDGNDVICGTECYFEILSGEHQPDIEEIGSDFQRWWERGEHWHGDEKPKSTDERIAELERWNSELSEALMELASIIAEREEAK